MDKKVKDSTIAPIKIGDVPIVEGSIAIEEETVTETIKPESPTTSVGDISAEDLPIKKNE